MTSTSINLNRRAWQQCKRLLEDAAAYRVDVHKTDVGSQLIDCGVIATGGLRAGCALAEICLAGLGQVRITAPRSDIAPGPTISVQTDWPIAGCMASQYAGWQVQVGDYFAMASGPMRAARGREELFTELGCTESPDCAVGVLESSQLPDSATCQQIAQECGLSPNRVTLLAARTASLAGTIQVVARTVETALHKLHVVGFDLQQVVSGFGVAPLPPAAADDLVAIGWTNDAVLYGGEVTLWVRAEDDELATIGPQIPSASSADFGRPFAEIFAHYNRDFYKIDPLLFSPARIRFCNLSSGREFAFGAMAADLLQESFRHTGRE